MRKTLLAVILTFTSLVLFGQSASIEGVVYAGGGKIGLAHVLVFNQDFVNSESNDDGEYSISLEAGTHELTFSLLGYDTFTKSISLEKGQTLVLDVQMNSKTVAIDQVVISASKFEQRLSELTVSMDVIKPDLIESKNTTSIDDILQNSSGVVIVDGEPQIRGGSGFSFGAGSRVTIMVDDMSMLSGDAGRPTWGFMPVENIEQIEIIKGASSVLYGSSALSGVINVRTAFPGDTPKTKITLFQGFYSDPQNEEAKYWTGTPMQSGVNLFHSKKIGNLGVVFGGSFLGDDGHLGPMFEKGGDSITSPYDPFDVNRYEAEYRIRGNMNLKYHFANVPGLNVGLNTNWLKGESISGLLWENNKEGLYSIYEGSATRTKQIVGNVDPYLSYLSKGGGKHVLRMRWQKLDNNNDNGQGNFSDVYFAEYQIHHSLDSLGLTGLKMTAGLVASKTNSTAELYSGGETNGENLSKNYAGYMQLDKKFFELLNVSAGIRYEYFEINSISESKPVFRSGVNYQVAEASFIRASYGQGYRFPTIAETYIQTSVGVINIYPNNEIRSESSENFELGLKQGFKFGKISGFADIAVFKQTYDDFVEFTFGQWLNPTIDNFLGLGFKSVNTGKAEVTGVEVTFIGAVKHKKSTTQFMIGYTYTKPITTTPDYVYADPDIDTNNILYRPDFSTFTYNGTSENPENNILKYRIQHLLRADIQYSTDKFDLGLSLRMNSQMENIDNIYGLLDNPDLQPNLLSGINEWRAEHTDPDFIFDCRLSYHINEQQKASVIINNFTNLEYSIRPMTIEAPRTIVLQYAFNL